MATGSPTDLCALGHDTCGLIGHLLNLKILTFLKCAGTHTECLNICALKACGLLVGQFNLVPETKVLLEFLLNFLPGKDITNLTTHLLQMCGESILAHLLVLQHLEVCLIVTCGQAKSSGLVIGGNDYESLFLVLEIEVIGNLDGLIKIKHLLNVCTGIIGMAGIVNTATLHHHEETLLGLFHHEVNGSLGNLG